jgi:photosystem II stability/assembly factor-like uncharacterized protein
LPAAAGIQWTPVGPYGGTVRSIAVDPSHSNVLYAATDNGVYKSTDGGAHWAVTSARFGDFGRAVWEVAVAPSSPSTLYVNAPGGVYRSLDAGKTWQARGVNKFMSTLAVDPHNASTLWAGSQGVDRGLLRSTDAGATWQVAAPLANAILEDVAFVPGHPERIFAGFTTSDPQKILRSTDGGATWEAVSAGLVFPAYGSTQISFAPSPDTPDLVFLAIAGPDDSNYEAKVFRSRDGGATWELNGPGGFPVAVGPGGAVYTGSGARSLDNGDTWSTPAAPNGVVLTLVADPLTPGTAWAGTEWRGVFKTTDSGASWRTAHQGINATSVSGLAIDPSDPKTLYAGLVGGGLFKTTQGGIVWQELDTGLPDPLHFSTYTALTVEPADPDRIWALAEEGRIVIGSTDGGATWKSFGSPGGPLGRLFGLAADPGAVGVLYAAGVTTDPNTCKSLKTVNGGTSWSCLSLGGALQIVVNPRNPAIVYAARPFTVAKSTDRGRTWKPARRGLPNSVNPVSLAESPSSPNVLYLGTFINGIYKSTDGAQSWKPASTGLPPQRRILSLAVDPRNPARAYAIVERSGFYRTVDGGKRWRPVNLGLPLTAVGPIVIDPDDPATLYTGVEVGGVYTITLR